MAVNKKMYNLKKGEEKKETADERAKRLAAANLTYDKAKKAELDKQKKRGMVGSEAERIANKKYPAR